MKNVQPLILVCILICSQLIGCGKAADSVALAPNSDRLSAKPSPTESMEMDDVLNDLKHDLAKAGDEMSQFGLDTAKEAIELKIVSRLDQNLEKWQMQVAEAFEDWSRDKDLNEIRDGSDLPDGHADYHKKDDQLRMRRDAILKGGTNQFKAAEKAVADQLMSVAKKSDLAQLESKELKSIQNEFKSQLDADLKRYESEIAVARKSIIAATKSAVTVALAPRLVDDLLKEIRNLKVAAASCPVIWDAQIPIDTDTRSNRLYLTRLFQSGHLKEIPQQDMVRVINAGLKTIDVPLRKLALDLCMGIDDATVFAKLTTKENLQNSALRKIALSRIPVLVTASVTNNTRSGSELLENLADAYLADPLPEHAAIFDDVINQIKGNSSVRQTKYYVWFLAAAAWSRSAAADREIRELYTSDKHDLKQILLLHEAADKRPFNSVVGALLARSAGKNAVVVFPQCVATIVPALREDKTNFRNLEGIRGLRQLDDFLIGWFAAVDPCFSSESLRIYQLVFNDPERQNLKGIEALVGAFESFRLGAIDLALRTPEGSPVEFLYRVDQLYWQSERVAALMALRRLGALDKVHVDALRRIVDNPWKGTAVYAKGMLTRPTQGIRINEWMLYATTLEKRSKESAIAEYLKAFLGQSAIRESLQGDAAMFPYRVYAMERILALNPGLFPELMKFAVTEKCPGALRLAILCKFAADHDMIGKKFLNEIPSRLRPAPYSPLTGEYVDGMLRAFEVVRTSKESAFIKSATDETAKGYAAVLLSYGTPDQTALALSVLKYKSIRPEPPDVDVSLVSDDSRITPFHFMSPETLIVSMKRLKPDADPKRVVDDYSKWRSKIWPSQDEPILCETADQIRSMYVAEQRLLKLRTTRDVMAEALKGFETDPSPETARRITTNWRSYEVDVVQRALRVLLSDPSALEYIGTFVSSVTKVSSSRSRDFEKTPNSSVLVQLQAEVLEAVFSDLKAHEAEVTDLGKRRRLEIQVIQPIFQFIQDSQRIIAESRDAKKLTE